MERNDVPVGFGMAFAMMTKEQKQAIWAQARNVQSRAEMQQLVADLPDRA